MTLQLASAIRETGFRGYPGHDRPWPWSLTRPANADSLDANRGGSGTRVRSYRAVVVRDCRGDCALRGSGPGHSDHCCAELPRGDPAHRHRVGHAEATATAAAAALAFNLFFLPPVGPLTIADPQNWVSFVAFLVTAVVASQLSGRARQRDRRGDRAAARSGAALRAQPGAAARRRDDCRSQRRSPATSPKPSSCQAVALYDRRTERSSGGRTGAARRSRQAARRRAPGGDAARASGLVVTAIRLGGAPIGSLAHHRRAAQRHGPAVGRQSRGHRPGAGARPGSRGPRRGGAAEQRASRDGARRAGARVQDAADVDARRPSSGLPRQRRLPTRNDRELIDDHRRGVDRLQALVERRDSDAADRRRRFRASTAIATVAG